MAAGKYVIAKLQLCRLPFSGIDLDSGIFPGADRMPSTCKELLIIAKVVYLTSKPESTDRHPGRRSHRHRDASGGAVRSPPADERDALEEETFPQLRAPCERHGARLQVVDLRWGVATKLPETSGQWRSGSRRSSAASRPRRG